MNEKIFKLTPVAALVLALACGVVRYFQIQTLTDFETGFFILGSETGGLLIYIMLAVSAAILIALSAAGKNKTSAFSVSSAGMGDNATRFLGFADIIGAFLMAVRITDSPSLVMTIFNVLGAGLLMLAGFALVLRIIPPAFTGHVRLITAAYLFFRLAFFFGSDLVVLRHAESLIILMSYVLFTAFITAQARFFARIEGKNSRFGEIILALLTFLCSMTHVVSDLIAMLTGGAAASFVSLNYDVAAAAVISGMFLFVVFFTEKKKDITVIEYD